MVCVPTPVEMALYAPTTNNTTAETAMDTQMPMSGVRKKKGVNGMREPIRAAKNT